MLERELFKGNCDLVKLYFNKFRCGLLFSLSVFVEACIKTQHTSNLITGDITVFANIYSYKLHVILQIPMSDVI